MKDFYYILGVNPNSSIEDVKKAHKKLSVKFHLDKNDGDEFFSERFKEIQSAYEALSDPIRRTKYDTERSAYANTKQSSANQGSNFTPEIEFFRTNKASFEYDEEITFSWKTINADKVSLKPFGVVPPIGQKTYKIKDFQNPSITVELTAENSAINRQVRSIMNLKNDTYEKLYQHFKSKISEEIVQSKYINSAQANKSNEEFSEGQFPTWFITILLLIIGLIFTFTILQ